MVESLLSECQNNQKIYQMTPDIMLVSLVFFGISILVSSILKSKFTKYGKIGLASGLTGKEIAEKMLRENGIYDVQVISVNGFLSDHYNPLKKTVNLSPEVYSGTSVAAAAVAAHECGHAVQHARAYVPLTMRSKLVPVVQFSSGLMNIVLLIGVAMLIFADNPTVLLVGIVLMAVTVLFSLISLPVEFDASKRALAWLQHTNVTNPREYPMAKDALKWAATTYVVAALGALVMLLQYIMLFLGSRRD